MEKILSYVLIVVLAVIVVASVSILFALPTFWIVNWLFAPSALIAVFGVSKITLWQALLAQCSLWLTVQNN